MILAHNNYSRTHPYFLHPQHQQHNTTNTFDSNHGLASVSHPTYNLNPSTSFDLPARQTSGNQYKYPSSSPFDSSINSQGLHQVPDLMPSSESWLVQNYQQTPRATQRMGHNRESSLSSLNSNGPASPYNTSTSNPHIALNDSSDGYHDLTGNDSNYSYQLGKPMANDNFYASIQGIGSSQGSQGNGMTDMSFADGLPNMSSSQQQHQPKRFANDRGLLPAADVASLGSRSVASSTVGDSQPATPSFQEPAEDETRRRKNVFQNVPKLDRTMTDVYSDELYSPHFTITSASPQPQSQSAMSPNSGLFAERLALANNQRLSAVQSPVSSSSRTNSPFRQGSPLAPSLNDFSQAAPQIRLNSAQQMREQQKQERDAQALREQLTRTANQQQGTPSTISPKDALLDFNESDDGADFPLFPAQETNNFDLNQLNKVVPQQQQQQPQQRQQPPQTQQRTPLQTAFDFSMPSSVQLPQQYPFVSRPRQQPATPSVANFSRMSSAETSGSSGSDGAVQRPMRTAADGGTYTCTYHGCTLRFDTPQLLQKHKREGHRQTNTLTPAKPVAPSPGVPETLLGSQAGPHRCDRINPSTGKSCNTVFSRPYDLTRHEDTIHNARKKKVRCNLCTEEKTFSRADALTRHYRVCHPDVEFPGKHRRRGGSVA